MMQVIKHKPTKEVEQAILELYSRLTDIEDIKRLKLIEEYLMDRLNDNFQINGNYDFGKVEKEKKEKPDKYPWIKPPEEFPNPLVYPPYDTGDKYWLKNKDRVVIC